MAEFKIELTDHVIINHAGLAFISKFLNDTSIFSKKNRVSKFKKNTGFISDYDVVKTIITLIALGKTSFDDVEMYRGDKYFRKVLNLKTVPSSVTIRQIGRAHV